MKRTFTLLFLSKTASCFSKNLFGKAVVLTMAMIIGLSTVKAQTWTSITPPSGCTGFLDIDFVDANNGALALTTGGDVAWTTNGGATWNKNADIAVDMYSVDMLDVNTIFATGGGTTGVKTLNGGATWSNLGTGGSAHMHGGIRMATASIGWRCDLNGNIYKTTDGGASFNLATNIGALNAFVKGYVVNTNVAYWPSGTSKTIKKTADGTTWNVVYTAATANILCVTGIDANNVWAGLSDGTIIKTTNGGANWTSFSVGANFQINDIDFISANEGWVAGNGGNIYYTSNGGSTWTQQSSGTTLNLSGISMVSSNLGFACTNDQTLYKFTNCTAEINLQGGSPLTDIVDGDVTPSTTDGTDFGNVAVSGSLARTFTIQNTGTTALTITSIASSNVKFVVSGAPASVAAGGSATFTVTFSPTATGVQNATITVNSSDCDEGMYDFAVTGTGATPGAALQFDGTDDYVSLNGTFGGPTWTEATVEAWVKVNATSADLQAIVSPSDLSFVHFQMFGAGSNVAFTNNNNVLLPIIPQTPTGQWRHLAMVIKSGDSRLYVDGVQQGATVTTTFGNILASNGVFIGRGASGGRYLNGQVDEVRIWNRALCQSEILAQKDCELTGSESGLVAYYKFNQGFANENNSGVTTLTDAAGGDNNGTLTNFALTGATSNWVNPGGVTTGTSCPASISSPEINVQGGSPLTGIVDGDATPSTTDGTDFGGISGTSLTRTFTIQNTGTSNLSVSTITVAGTNASEFVVGGITLPATVTPGTSTTFTVTFTPTANGTRTATVTVNNNDCDEAAYDFAVSGGRQGAALAFDGVDDRVPIASQPLANINQFTFETYVNIRSNATYSALYAEGLTSSLNPMFSISVLANGGLELVLRNASSVGLAVNTAAGLIPVGQWKHVAFVRTSATTALLYIDGVQQGSYTFTDPGAISVNVTNIGARQRSTFDGYLIGSLDEVRLWNTARSCEEISQLRNCELAGNESGLIGYYQFNQGIADGTNTGITTLTNAVSGGLNGTLTNFSLGGTTSNWTSPGGVTTGTSCTAVTVAEINVQGGSPLTDIADGDVTPSTTDGTDLGNVAVSGSLARTFTIQNTGTTVLTITSITSSNALFVVSGAPASVAAGSSATFTVTFSPTATGVQNATITVNNSDCDEGVYDFAVTGKGVNPGAALHFDGVNDNVSIPSTAALQLDQFTLETWFNPSTAANFPALPPSLIAKGAGIPDYYLVPAISSRKISGGFYTGSTFVYVTSTTDLAQNTWYHLATTFDGTTLKMYVNGVLENTVDAGGLHPRVTANALSLGLTNANQYINGALDEVRIWNVARSCEEIRQLRSCELTGSESGLVAYYKFNQGFANENNSGVTTLTDAAGGDNNGTLTNFALTGATSNWVNPGGVTTGTSCSAVTAAEINVQGGSPLTDIADGDVTPSTTDGTDLGNVAVSGSLARTFTIQNTGTAVLTIASITSSNVKFVVSGAPASVAAGGSATFTVTFSPTATGVQNATITVNNSDCDEGVYDFAVTGTGVTPGAALNFDGVNDYVTLPNESNFDFTNAMTVETWIKVNAFDINKVWTSIVAKGDDSWRLTRYASSNNITFIVQGGALVISTTNFNDGNWHHLAGVYTGTNVLLYVDGNLEASAATSVTIPNSAYNVTIGENLQQPGRYFDGTIDEVRIWNTARTCEQIRQFRNCELTGSEANLVAYYKFNQGIANGNNSGVTTLTDATSGNNNGTLNGFGLTGATSNWVNPGGVTTGISCPATITAAEINVQGGSPLVTIVDGDITPSTTDGTDFGNLLVNGSSAKNYTIQNTGTAALTITSITSSNVKFVVSGAPTSVAAGGSATFTVTFSPTATGVQNATITVNNSDCDEGVYDFAVTGKGVNPGAALHFDGVNDNVSIPDDAALHLDNFTMETWFNPSVVPFGGTNTAALIAKGSGGFPDYFLAPVTGTRKIAVGFYSGSSFYGVNSTTDLNQNTWYHIAGTFDGTNVKIYINGVLEGTASAGGAHPRVTTNALSLGLTNVSWYINGALDDVRIWNVARSCEEINQLRNCELTGSEANLVAYYTFNQGFGNENNSGVTTLTDLATGLGGTNNGTLSGFGLTGATSNWINPGGVTTGTSCPASITFPEINVQGGSPLTNIVDGDITPSTTDGTDFGNVVVNGSSAKSYTIQNTGTSVLTISSITSSNVKFVVSGAPTSIAAGSSATFTVTFSPTATGVQNATITVNNSDCDEGVYDFAVTGKGADQGASLNFDGVNDYISTANNTSLDLSVQTVEFWAKPTGGGDNDLLVGKRNYGGLSTSDVRWSIHFQNGNQGLYFFTPAGTAIWSYSFTPNQWYHIAMVTDATSTKLYIDGTFISSMPTTINSPTNLPLIFGASAPNYEVFPGNLDEVRIWNTARTCDEINQLRNCELTGSEANLKAYYKFNQGLASENNSGVTTLTDATSGNNNGTLLNFGLTGASSNWVTPGGVTTGISCPAVMPAEINLQGGSPLVSIVDGDVTPSTTDGTDFGNVLVNGSSAKSFTIQNTGTGTLAISSITSSNTLFVVSGGLTSVAAGSSATFTVTFSPTATGVQNATITVNNSDCDEGVYDFAITGNGANQGAALIFDGVNDFVNCGSSSSLVVTSGLTMEAWVNQSASNTNDKYIFNKEGEYEWAITNGNVHYAISNTSPGWSWINTGVAVAANTWTHLALTYDGSTIKVYKNGVLSYTATGSGNIADVLPAENELHIGSRQSIIGNNANKYFNGRIDEVRIWNIARTCDQISQTRNCELTGSESGLVAYYKFNQGFASENNSGVTTLTDATSNNNNGTLSGFALTGAASNWVTPGGVTTGTSCTAITAAEINVQGGSPLVSIADGDVTPLLTDGTDFGNVLLNGSSAKIYTIQNTGNVTLTISSITSSNTLFVVSGGPTSVAAGSSATFTVTFSPTATGVQNATITVNNSDCDEGVYDFAITGNGANPGAALSFDGANDYVDCGNATGFNPNNIKTMETWVKFNSLTNDQDIMTKANTCTGTEMLLFGSNLAVYFMKDCSNFSRIEYPKSNLTAGQWYHIAVTWDGTKESIKLYVNGVSVGTLIHTGNINATGLGNPANGFFLGQWGPLGRPLNGYMDDARVWSTTRTCDEINQLRNCELTGTETGLLAYYKFNQGFAGVNNNTPPTNTLTDATANGNNGTLINFALTGATSNWVTPGAVTTGTICPAVSSPEANVQGGSPLVTIVDGDVTPSTTDGTDFGIVIPGNNLARTFTIQNTGSGALTISSITSSNALFVVSGAPTSVAAGSSATFTVTFSPTGNGSPTATITINNNDCDEGVYDFAVSGTGCVAPSFTVCPASTVTANTSAGQCSAAVTYTVTATGTPSPTLTYALTGATTGTGNGTGSGSTFNKGNTTVTVTATNGCGSNAVCTFTVTVADNEPPVLTCAANVTVNNTTGLCTGTATLTAPTVADNCTIGGNGLDFGGDNDYISFPSNAIATATAFTVEAWLNERSYASWARVFDFGNSNANLVMLAASVGGSGTPAFYIIKNGGAQQVTAPGTIPLNTWTHLAVTLSGTTATMYINGVQVAQNTGFTLNPATVGATTNNWLGRSQQSLDSYLDAKLDEVRFWNVARTQSQIQASMNNELVGNESGLVAYYRLNQGTPGGNNAGVTTATATAGPNGTLNGFALSGTSSNWVSGALSGLTNNAPTTYPKGLTTVTWTGADAAGNTATCQQIVTVVDNEVPVLTAPANQTLNVITNTCAANYTIADPIADNCTGATWTYTLSGATTFGPSAAIADGTGSGAVSFNKGVTTVTLNGVDGSGNNAVQKTFTVTVNDNIVPTISGCPANQSLTNASGVCSQTYSIPFPTLTDNCAGPLTWNAIFSANPIANPANLTGLANGTNSTAVTFNKGATTVILSATDATGNNSTVNCAFTVTVTDNEPPVVTCAPNITVNNTTGLCTGTATLTSPLFVDNCSAAPGNALDFDGSDDYISFPYNLSGVTTFTYETWVKVRANQAWARILDFGNAAGLNIFFTTSQAGTGQPRFVINIGGGEQLLTGPSALPLNTWTHLAVTVNGSTAILYVNGVNVAQNNAFTYTPASLGTTTNNWIGRSQYADPYFNGQLDEIRFWNVVRTQAQIQAAMNTELTGSETGLIHYYRLNQGTSGGNNAGITSAIDTKGANGTLNLFALTGTTSNWVSGQNVGSTLTNNAPSTYPKGPTTVTWTGTDAAGNSATCQQIVTVVDNQVPVLTAPANQAFNVIANTCAANYTIADPIADNCTGSTWGYTLSGATTATVTGIADGTGSGVVSFNGGVTTVTLTGVDASGNAAVQKIFTVTVTDNIAPSITCPVNIAVNNDVDQCSAAVIYTAPVGTDNCSGATTTRIGGLASGAVFPVGTTTNTFRVTAANGQTATCAFTVTVTDSQAPAITCPANLAVNNDVDQCSAVVAYTAPAGTDNCSGATTAQTGGLASGAVFPVGTTTNTFRVTAANGQTATCAFTVTVTDSQAPAITCPANLAVNNDVDQCSAVVAYTAPAGTDNCSGATTAQTGGLASGATFPVGSTTNIFRVTAANGQTSTCTFTVTVTDNQAPAITCPVNIAVGNDAGQCNAVVTYTAPVGSDNCSGASTSRTGGLASGVTYPLGITTNTFTVTASNGQTASCAFTVTVSDTELPAVTCPANKTVLQVQGSCISVATGIDATYSDNCAGATLSYSSTGVTTLSGTGQASGQTFNTGVTTVIYTATDAVAQVSTCSFTVTMAPCFQISGNIKWENNNAPVKSADVKLEALPGLAQVGLNSTDVNGNYTVIPGVTGDYRVRPEKNTGLFNGVTSADATRIQQHIINTPPLVGPYKRIAADVNKSNSITTADATLITQALAGNPASLAIFNTSWRFVPASYVFPSPTVPWGFPEKVDFTGLTTSQTNVNFIGVKIGDVNGSANPLLKPVHPLVWMVNEAVLQQGEMVEATFRVGQLEDIAAFQFALEFDTRELALEDIQTAGPLSLNADNFGTYSSKDGEIRAVWAVAKGETLKEGTKVFTIRFKALSSGRKLSDLLHLEEAVLHGAAYNTELNEAGVELVFTDAEVTGTAEQDLSNRLILLQNQPNPTSGHTTIGFVLPQSCEAQLRIVDVNGRTVTEVNKSYPAGYQAESFDLSNYPGGVLYYELTTPYGSLVKKMIVSR